MREAIPSFCRRKLEQSRRCRIWSAPVLQAGSRAISSLEKAEGDTARLSPERIVELKTILGAVTAVYYES